MTDENMIYAPFNGTLPSPTYAAEVIAPPYDVLSSEEARVKAQNKPYSFLHISKAEIDLPEDISIYDDRVYAKASENFQNLCAKKILTKSPTPCYYIYQLQMGSHIQTGLVVAASVKAYTEGRIKRHELTRIAKENDRVKQIRTVGAQTGPALLINKNIPEIKSLLKSIITTHEPYFSVKGDNDIRHSLWIIDDKEQIDLITTAFNAQNEAYIADGHHRSAAAARLAAEDGTTDTARFLAVAFFADEMMIMDYNRFVRDLNKTSKDEFLRKISQSFDVSKCNEKKPNTKGCYTMYLDHQWYKLNVKELPQTDDPVALLDVSILSDKVLDKILGITDLRNDERIDFIGGIRGPEEIEKLVDAKPNSVGFMVYRTSVEELISVADKHLLMPPKSTWFEPKLADGVVSK